MLGKIYFQPIHCGVWYSRVNGRRRSLFKHLVFDGRKGDGKTTLACFVCVVASHCKTLRKEATNFALVRRPVSRKPGVVLVHNLPQLTRQERLIELPCLVLETIEAVKRVFIGSLHRDTFVNGRRPEE